jgi:mono/diheme cytochrome c family protein
MGEDTAMKKHRRAGAGLPSRTASASVSRGILRPTLIAALVLIAVAAVVVGIAAYSVGRRGLSARAEPSWLEEFAARTMRSFATPASMRNRPNPVQPTEAVLDEALEHFADHCAVCHANNGSGDTEIGRGLYPKAPDMRASATQSLTDGELFSIIENGIRLTGMPAWGDGTPEGGQASWGLVHFIHRLPQLTTEQIERMEALNPKTPAQLREEEETRRFLEGETATPPAKPVPPHRHRE